jgi:hypothetical protein
MFSNLVRSISTCLFFLFFFFGNKSYAEDEGRCSGMRAYKSIAFSTDNKQLALAGGVPTVALKY